MTHANPRYCASKFGNIPSSAHTKAIVQPVIPTTAQPANPTMKGFGPTPLKTLALVPSPTAAIAAHRGAR